MKSRTAYEEKSSNEKPVTHHYTGSRFSRSENGKWRAGALILLIVALGTACGSRSLKHEAATTKTAAEAMADLQHPLSVTERHQFLVPAARLWMTDPEPHLTAIRVIGREGDEQAVTQLLEALADQSFPYRAEAAIQLARISNPLAVPGLSAALSDRDPEVRAASAGALGAILKDNRIDGSALAALIEPLMTLLKEDPDPLTRYAAYRALSNSKDWDVFLRASALAGSDPHLGLRSACFNARVYFATLSDQDSVRRDGAVVCRETLTEPQPMYVRLTLLRSRYLSKYPRGVLRVEAVKALGAMRQGEDVATLRALRSDPDAAIREAAVLALAELQGDSALPDVLPALGDPVYAVRARAIALLAGLGESGGEVLGRVVRNGTTFERLRAATALRNVPGQAEALVKALDDDDPQVRRAVKQALIAEQAPESVPLLIGALSAQQSRLRVEATRVLSHYHGEDSRTQLIRALQTGASPSAPLAALALGLRGEPEAREALETALVQAGFPDPIAAVHALQDLEQRASLPALADFVRAATDFEAKAAAELAMAVIAGANN